MPDQHEPRPYQPKPRYLAPRASAGWDGHGYRHLPSRSPRAFEQESPETLAAIRDATSIRDEPECLDRDDWDRHIGREVDQRARARDMERERNARLLSQEERIVKAQAEAAAKRRDVTRELWVLRQMQAKQRPPEKIEKRVQHLELVVYMGRRAA